MVSVTGRKLTARTSRLYSYVALFLGADEVEDLRHCLTFENPEEALERRQRLEASDCHWNRL
jgi:hypothetical protein